MALRVEDVKMALMGCVDGLVLKYKKEPTRTFPMEECYAIGETDRFVVDAGGKTFQITVTEL